MFKRLKKLLRRNEYIDTVSPAFLNKAKSNTENSFVCIVTEIDTTFDTVTVYSFHHDTEITFPMSYEYSININDIILVINIDGIYHIVGKANIDYIRDERYIYNPDSMEKDELLKVQKVDISSLPKVDYISGYHIKKDIGEIVKHIKITGYKIREEAVYLFSGITRFIATLSDLYGVSKKIKFQLFNNKSFFELNETDDGADAYNIVLFNKNEIPYFIEIKGNIISALNNNEITLENMPFDITDESVYFKAIFTKVESDANEKNKISHQYINRENTFSTTVEAGNGISEDMVDKIKPYIKKETLLGKKPIFILNKNDKYECKIIRMETISGTVYNYCEKEISYHKDYKMNYSNKNIQASDFNSTYWSTSFEEYNYPYTLNSFKITNTYANEEKNNYSLLHHKKWTYFINEELNTRHTQEICEDCNIDTIRVEEIPYLKSNYSFVQENYEKIDKSNSDVGKVITISKNTNKVTYIMNTNIPFFVSAKIGEKRLQVSADTNSMLFSGFKNIMFQNIQNIIASDSTLNINKLYVFSDSLFKGAFYITNNSSIILNSKNFYITSDASLIKSDNVVLYGTKSAALYSSDNISGGGVFINPNIVSISAEQISIPGYCRC